MAAELSGLQFEFCFSLVPAVVVTAAGLFLLACLQCYKKMQVLVSPRMVNLSSGRKRENNCKTTFIPREGFSSSSAAVKRQFTGAFKHALKSIPAKQNT